MNLVSDKQNTNPNLPEDSFQEIRLRSQYFFKGNELQKKLKDYEGLRTQNQQSSINSINTSNDDIMSLEEHNEIPLRKPLSAYVLFGNQQRDAIRDSNPSLKVTDIVREIAKQWQALSKQEKLVYKHEAKKDKERYDNELQALLLESEQFSKPKCALTAYMFFVRDTRNKIKLVKPDIAPLDIMKEVGKAWQSISKTKLKKYQDLAEADLVRYQEEYSNFIRKINKVKPPVKSKEPSKQLSQYISSNIGSFQNDYNSNKRRKTEDISIFGNQNLDNMQDDNQNEVSNIQEQNQTEQCQYKKPKKPLSPYIFFCQGERDNLKKNNPTWSSHEIMKRASRRWKKMTLKEKESYQLLAQEDKQRYDRELRDKQSRKILEYYQIQSANDKVERVQSALTLNSPCISSQIDSRETMSVCSQDSPTGVQQSSQIYKKSTFVRKLQFGEVERDQQKVETDQYANPIQKINLDNAQLIEEERKDVIRHFSKELNLQNINVLLDREEQNFACQIDWDQEFQIQFSQTPSEDFWLEKEIDRDQYFKEIGDEDFEIDLCLSHNQDIMAQQDMICGFLEDDLPLDFLHFSNQ